MRALLVIFMLLSGAASAETPAVPVASVQAEMRLGMRKSGDLTQVLPNGTIRNTQTFILTVGDPSREDERYSARASSDLGAFNMDSAQYFHNDDSTWRLFSFRWPRQGESEKFIDFLTSPAGTSALRDPYLREDTGSPDDFVYKKMRVAKRELPPPLNRATDKTLKAVAGIFRYHGDGTMKIFLKGPLDQEENAKKVYWQLKKEIEAR